MADGKKYRCPECGAESFIVTAHVTQDWKIDSEMNFLECVSECEEVTHHPDEDDIWQCAGCEYSGPGHTFQVGTETI